jgi:Glycosyltransferase sugar-binding region containing DXD motif
MTQTLLTPTLQPSPLQSQKRQEVRVFWTGPSLSLYEQLSLRSFVAAGARVQLFSYDDDFAIPDGVELINANEILPGPVYAFRHASGDKSLALHSDLFRYVAIEKYGGWYVDADIVFIGSQLPDSPVYIARETEQVINGAVMKFPAHAPLLVTAIEEARRLLPQTAVSSSHEARLLIGPPLVTRLLREFSLEHMVRPRSSAYEIGYDEIPAFFDPASCERLQERLADSDFTHLWNEVWRWIRIPKNYGPPEGSYLDSLFRRLDMKSSPQARLSYGAITDWFREHRLLQEVKYRVGTDRLPADAMDRLTGWFRDIYRPQGGTEAVAAEPVPLAVKTAVALPLSTAPQVMQTFWHGDVISPYQLLCLRSFADRGHQVEVFSYESALHLPGWLERRNAAEILPRDKILRPIDGGLAIHGNLFRYALLNQRGGWWIDPDVLLLKPDLPAADVFFAGPDAFGLTSTALLRFPKGHPVIKAGLAKALTLDDAVADWEASGAALLTELIRQHGLDPDFHMRRPLGPVSWFDVPALFNPLQCDRLERLCQPEQVLHLHVDAWLRSGVPQRLGPPEGSLLDSLLARHEVMPWFPDRMTFNEVNRWIRHMYECFRSRER